MHRVSGDGELRDVTVAWQRGAADGPPSWRVRAAFDRASLAMAPTEFQLKNPRALRVPDLQDIAGSFEATEAGGKAVLRTPAPLPRPMRAGARPPAAAVRLCRLGRAGRCAAAGDHDPLRRHAGRAGGGVQHRSTRSSPGRSTRAAGREWLAVQVDRLVFANADGSASVTGRYRPAAGAPASLDLRARIGSLQASKVWRYLPHEVPENVRRWIREALEAGVLEGGEARWRGDIRDFPYRLKTPEEQGEFRFTAKVRDLLLKYAPEWPALHGIAGDLVFDRVGMDFRAERATLLEVPLTGVTARMDDVASGMLEVDGKAQGDLAQMLKFVNTSPLADGHRQRHPARWSPRGRPRSS